MIFMVGWGYDDMLESIAKVSDNEMDTWNNWVENNGGDVQFGRFVNAEAERRARESKGWTEEDTKDLEELKKWVFDDDHLWDKYAGDDYDYNYDVEIVHGPVPGWEKNFNTKKE